MKRNVRLLALLFLGMLLATGTAAEFRRIYPPEDGDGNLLAGFSVYNHKGYWGQLSTGVADGVPAVQLRITHWQPGGNAQRIQLRLTTQEGILAGTEYRLRFRFRADRPALLSYRVQEGSAPWPTVTEHAPGYAWCTPVWKQAEYCFTAHANTDGRDVWFPIFEAGWLGKDNVLSLADVQIEALD